MLAAQQYYVDNGADMIKDQLSQKIPQYLPQFAITGEKPINYWSQLIVKAFNKVVPLVIDKSCN